MYQKNFITLELIKIFNQNRFLILKIFKLKTIVFIFIMYDIHNI